MYASLLWLVTPEHTLSPIDTRCRPEEEPASLCVRPRCLLACLTGRSCVLMSAVSLVGAGFGWQAGWVAGLGWQGLGFRLGGRV